MVGSICKKKCRIERASLAQWKENTKTDFFITTPEYNVTDVRGIKGVTSRIQSAKFAVPFVPFICLSDKNSESKNGSDLNRKLLHLWKETRKDIHILLPRQEKVLCVRF